MLAARVEPKNGPKENKKIGNFKPLALSEFQAAVDSLPRRQRPRRENHKLLAGRSALMSPLMGTRIR